VIGALRKMSTIFKVGIATYEEVIDALRDFEKYIVDVREPEEIKASGQIPKSINIPCKYYIQHIQSIY
jgi:3-mercaptopyruvate sulfurtransferase SseA